VSPIDAERFDVG